jgi:hypothetical protein
VGSYKNPRPSEIAIKYTDLIPGKWGCNGGSSYCIYICYIKVPSHISMQGCVSKNGKISLISSDTDERRIRHGSHRHSNQCSSLKTHQDLRPCLETRVALQYWKNTNTSQPTIKDNKSSAPQKPNIGCSCALRGFCYQPLRYHLTYIPNQYARTTRERERQKAKNHEPRNPPPSTR